MLNINSSYKMEYKSIYIAKFESNSIQTLINQYAHIESIYKAFILSRHETTRGEMKDFISRALDPLNAVLLIEPCCF